MPGLESRSERKETQRQRLRDAVAESESRALWAAVEELRSREGERRRRPEAGPEEKRQREREVFEREVFQKQREVIDYPPPKGINRDLLVASLPYVAAGANMLLESRFGAKLGANEVVLKAVQAADSLGMVVDQDLPGGTEGVRLMASETGSWIRRELSTMWRNSSSRGVLRSVVKKHDPASGA